MGLTMIHKSPHRHSEAKPILLTPGSHIGDGLVCSVIFAYATSNSCHACGWKRLSNSRNRVPDKGETVHEDDEITITVRMISFATVTNLRVYDTSRSTPAPTSKYNTPAVFSYLLIRWPDEIQSWKRRLRNQENPAQRIAPGCRAAVREERATGNLRAKITHPDSSFMPGLRRWREEGRKVNFGVFKLVAR